MDETISIIVPVYNASLYLKQCLDSIINQTYKKLEIICVNDESTDNSLEILNTYKNVDERVTIIDKKNEGVSLARNAALDIATGKYILFVDADDWIDIDTCAKALEQIRGADVLMWSYIREFKEKSAPKRLFPEGILFDEQAVKKHLHRRMIGIVGDELRYPENADALCTIWGKLYCREVIGDIRFVDIRKIGTYEDGLFNLMVFEKAKWVKYVDQYYYHYRKTNESSLTSAYRPQQKEKFSVLYDWMEAYINEGPWNYEQALSNRIALSTIGLGLNIMSANCSMLMKCRMIKELIDSEKYKNAYRNLDMSYFPIHWKTFFYFAKYRSSVGLYWLLLIIRWIISK